MTPEWDAGPVRPRHPSAVFIFDIGTAENLVVNMNGGDDTFTVEQWPGAP